RRVRPRRPRRRHEPRPPHCGRRTGGSAGKSARPRGLSRRRRGALRNGRRHLRERGMALLEIRDLDAWYGRAQILFGVSLSVEAGEAAVLIGRNGAGKSTLMKCVMGLEAERRGVVHFDGVDLIAEATHRIARRGIGYVPEDRRIFMDLTVAENLAVGRLPPPLDETPWTPEAAFELFPPLAAMRDRK